MRDKKEARETKKMRETMMRKDEERPRLIDSKEDISKERRRKETVIVVSSFGFFLVWCPHQRGCVFFCKTQRENERNK